MWLLNVAWDCPLETEAECDRWQEPDHLSGMGEGRKPMGVLGWGSRP